MAGSMEAMTDEYTASLESYLTDAPEEALQRAYEVGRKAVAEGVGVLEMAAVHNRALAKLLGRTVNRAEAGILAEQASLFFAESLSPFEMVLRGYREANEQLRANLQQLETADRTLQKQNQELAAAHRLVEAERQRYQELFHFAPGGYLVTDLDGMIQEANNPASVLLASRHPLAGQSLVQLVEGADREALKAQLAELKSRVRSEIQDWQINIPSRAGGAIAVSFRAEPVRDSAARPVALRWLVSDVSERKRIEEERTQLRIREHTARMETEAARRLQFLGEASAMLASSLDPARIAVSTARLPVSYLADICAIHLVDAEGMVQQVAVCSAGLTDVASMRHWQDDGPVARPLPPHLASVLNANRAEQVQDIAEDWLNEFAAGPEIASLLAEARVRSLLLVPLVGQGRALGTMTLGRSEGRPAFSASECDLAVDLARRCSLVLDNALLHAQVVIERDRASTANRAKDEFVAVLSHELRTPLTAILGWVRILKRQATSQDALGEGVRVLEHNTRHVARLVEDCLDVARIAERKIQLQRERIDLNEIVKNALDSAREAAQEKNLRFLVHLSPSSLWVSGDRIRLEQVVSNLLSNAARYTAADGLISVTSEAAGEEAEVSVQDTGIGIAPELLEQIFEPFRQAGPNWLASDSGLGLGLAIARQIAQVHGGKVWAESPGPGSGSTFRLRLPLIAGEPFHDAVKALPAEIDRDAGTHRILFIEDSVEILNLMRIELGELGFDVLTASDARTGLEMAYGQRPEVIVSDIKMPGMDGYEFVRRLRDAPELSAIPVIALTGFGMPQDVEKALAAGYTAHLCKPVEIDQLASLIRKLATR
jgi:PAS domain S-box-containing protein